MFYRSKRKRIAWVCLLGAFLYLPLAYQRKNTVFTSLFACAFVAQGSMVYDVIAVLVLAHPARNEVDSRGAAVKEMYCG